MHRVYLILGSNIDKERNLPAAVQLLATLSTVVAVSGVYETAPQGTLDQPNFFNAAVLLHTELDAATLKTDVLAEVERRLKRVRVADKNAPRTIDVDIVLFNDWVLDFGRYHIPDPDLVAFAHVAVPVAELAGGQPHPETGEPLDALAARLRAGAVRDGHPTLWRRDDVILWNQP